MNKRGMSAVVSVVLIVLLALVAVVIVWALVSNIVGDVEEEAGGDTALVGTGFTIVARSVGIDDDQNVSFIIEKDAGGEAEGFVLFLEDDSGNGVVVSKYEDTKMEELERREVFITSSEHGLGNIAYIEVYPVVAPPGVETPVMATNPSATYGTSTGGGGSTGGTGSECDDDGDCDDGEACNGVETCVAGSCVGGTPVVCDDGNDCTANICNSGACEYPPVVDGSVCTLADDGLPSTDPECVSGTCSHVYQYFRVFVTNDVWNASLGGIVGAEAKCQAAADAQFLGGDWKTWISNSTTSATDLLYHSLVEYQKLDGTVIADDWSDLTDSSIYSPINLTEDGTTEVGPSDVWTSTSMNGDDSGGSMCADWTTDDSTGGEAGRYGQTEMTNSQWTYYSLDTNRECQLYLRLYCFEQPVP